MAGILSNHDVHMREELIFSLDYTKNIQFKKTFLTNKVLRSGWQTTYEFLKTSNRYTAVWSSTEGISIYDD